MNKSLCSGKNKKIQVKKSNELGQNYLCDSYIVKWLEIGMAFALQDNWIVHVKNLCVRKVNDRKS